MEDAHLVDFNSGLGSLPEYPTTSELETRPESDRRASEITPSGRRQGWKKRLISQVQILGGNAGHPDFHTALKDALADIARLYLQQGDERLRKAKYLEAAASMVDPMYAAVRGAALHSRRKRESQYTCVEDEKRGEAERQREWEGKDKQGFVVPEKQMRNLLN